MYGEQNYFVFLFNSGKKKSQVIFYFSLVSKFLLIKNLGMFFLINVCVIGV